MACGSKNGTAVRLAELPRGRPPHNTTLSLRGDTPHLTLTKERGIALHVGPSMTVRLTLLTLLSLSISFPLSLCLYYQGAQN